MSEFPSIEQLREAVAIATATPVRLQGWPLDALNTLRLRDAVRFLLSLLDEGGRLVVEAPCGHGELEPHGWVCGEHDTDEKCPRQNCEAYLDFGDHCARLHRDDDVCWSASACGGGSRRRVFPRDP